MTRNLKADLQRKLVLAPVATPPDGLSDRIKAAIPHNLGLEPESERTRLRQPAFFNLRIAASIILLASSLYFGLHLLSHSEQNNTAPAVSDRAASPVPHPIAVALPDAPPLPGSVRVRPIAGQPSLPSEPPARIASARLTERMTEKKREESDAMNAGAPAFADTVEAPRAAAEPLAMAKAAPVPEMADASAVEGGRAAPEPERGRIAASSHDDRDRSTSRSVAAESIASAAAAGTPLVAPAVPPALGATDRPDQANPLAYSPKPAPLPGNAPVRNFIALEESIARGESPRNIDLATIVRHFSAPESAPSGIRVELEASATPLDATKWLLRVSVDAPASTRTEITLTFGDAVATHRTVNGPPAANETALYEIEFKRNATPGQTIATVRAGAVEHSLHASDLHPWNAASSRMKRASLAAAWARTLQSRTPAAAIVARAREAHFDELADLAEQAERNR